MSIFLLMLLIFISLSMLVWGLRCPNGLLTFPVLSAGAWLGFVVPQFIGIMANPARLPYGVIRDWGIELTMLMCIACALFSFVGYLKPPSRLLPHRRNVRSIFHYSDSRLFISGMVLVLVGLWGFYRLTRLSGGILAHFSTEGHYTLEWSGLPVMYVFFANMTFPGLALCLLVALKYPSKLRWIGVGLASLYPVIHLVLLGRRETFVRLALIFTIIIYFVLRKIPPRWLLIPAVMAAFFVVRLGPVYRTHFRIGGDLSQLRSLSVSETTAAVFRGDVGVQEAEYSVVQIAAAHRSQQFNYGVGFYNLVVSRWVPRLIFGDAAKSSLYLPLVNLHAYIRKFYNAPAIYGSTYPTGYAEVFREFWFFGALIFLIIGSFYRVLWEWADAGSLSAQLFYVLLAIRAINLIIRGFLGLPAELIGVIIFLLPILFFSRYNFMEFNNQKRKLFNFAKRKNNLDLCKALNYGDRF